VDGQPQSYVDLTDPLLLGFEYVSHLALVLDTLPPGRLAMTHVGGGGLTLPRWVEATRPGSPQVVLEPDSGLTEAVRDRLPLPRSHRIRVRAVDGRTGTAALATASADVLVLDAYAAGRVPAELVAPAYLACVARVLRPGGLLLANLADEPGLRYVARVLATAEATAGLAVVALIATHDVLKGKRFGNAVVVMARAGPPADGDPMPDLGAALARAVGRSAFPTGVRTGPDLVRLVAGAHPFTDADAQPSPEPPDPGTWRLR
jgi:hypothetical protein